MIIYKTGVSVDEFFACEVGLVGLHWEEIAANKESIHLKPDIEKYKLLESMGYLKTIAAFEDGVIVGYSVILIQPHLHYMDDLYAFVDVIYVDPAYRNSRVGLVLIKMTEDLAKESGASVLIHHAKPNHPALETILKRKGYKVMEVMLGKLLKEG